MTQLDIAVAVALKDVADCTPPKTVVQSFKRDFALAFLANPHPYPKWGCSCLYCTSARWERAANSDYLGRRCDIPRPITSDPDRRLGLG